MVVRLTVFFARQSARNRQLLATTKFHVCRRAGTGRSRVSRRSYRMRAILALRLGTLSPTFAPELGS